MNSQPRRIDVDLTDVALEILSWLGERRILANYIALLADELDRMTGVNNTGSTVGQGATLAGGGTMVGLGVATAFSFVAAGPLVLAGAAVAGGVAVAGKLEANHSELLKNLLETQICTSAGKAWEDDHNTYNRCSDLCRQINVNEIQTSHAKRLHLKVRMVLSIQKKEGAQRGLERDEPPREGGIDWFVRELFLVKTFSDFVKSIHQHHRDNPCDMAIKFRQVAQELLRQLDEHEAQLTQMLESSVDAGDGDPGFHE